MAITIYAYFLKIKGTAEMEGSADEDVLCKQAAGAKVSVTRLKHPALETEKAYPA
ncbi:MAG: hypothetical protein ACQES5_12325 [Thermodesulfobacteriota bacterium]